MANVEKDPVSGRYTTGHEWDGIKELNTPLPKWWVYVFYVSIAWSLVYWVLMPSWPTVNGYWKGTLGYSSRGNLAAEVKAAKDARAVWESKIEAATLEQITKDKDLLNYSIAGGKTTFAENCAPCHGSGGVGAYGFPSLVDDKWIWGGSLEEIHQTISYGVRNASGKSRQSEMPKFGAEKMLTAEQIDKVADYVVAVAGKQQGAGEGKAIFAEQCAGCHGDNAEGNKEFGAPAFDGVWLYKGDKKAVVEQVNLPKHGTMPAWSERLSPTTIKELAVYVHALGGGK